MEKFENANSILKSLQSGHFLIVEQVFKKLSPEVENGIFTMPRGFVNSCPVVYDFDVYPLDLNRIPSRIPVAKLKYDGDKQYCIPVYRNVMIIRKKRKCHHIFHQKLYRTGRKRVIVAYERIEKTTWR